MNYSFVDICGIIANATFAKSAENSCKVLMEMEVVKSCAPAKTHTAGKYFK